MSNMVTNKGKTLIGKYRTRYDTMRCDTIRRSFVRSYTWIVMALALSHQARANVHLEGCNRSNKHVLLKFWG